MQEQNKQHSLSLENRRILRLTDVTDVDRFDEREILLYTRLGELTIAGRQLQIRSVSLENGEMLVEGDIWMLQYGDKDKHNALTPLRKLLR